LGFTAGSPASGGTTSSNPPVAIVSSPREGSTVSGSVTLTSSISGGSASSVSYYINNLLVGSSSSGPNFPVSFDTTGSNALTSNGPYYVYAIASDGNGNGGSTGVTHFTVNNCNCDLTPPTVSLTSPTDGSTVSGSVNVTASASDNVGVA